MLENNVDFCGVVRTFYDKEKTKVEEEYFIMNGKIEGIYKLYHENGQLCSEVNYIDGKREGIFKSYYQNGQLYVEVNYIDGKRDNLSYKFSRKEKWY
jgi:antitoxin component YwqK of YwqJK toxin-antitoxin module